MTEGPAVRTGNHERRRMTLPRASLYGFILLAVASWGFIVFGDATVSGGVRTRRWGKRVRFLGRCGPGSDGPPAYLQGEPVAGDGQAWRRRRCDEPAGHRHLPGVGAFATLLMEARNVRTDPGRKGLATSAGGPT